MLCFISSHLHHMHFQYGNSLGVSLVCTCPTLHKKSHSISDVCNCALNYTALCPCEGWWLASPAAQRWQVAAGGHWHSPPSWWHIPAYVHVCTCVCMYECASVYVWRCVLLLLCVMYVHLKLSACSKWLLLSWLLHKWKREFSDTNFEIGKPYWLNANLHQSPNEYWSIQSKHRQGFLVSKLVSKNSLSHFILFPGNNLSFIIVRTRNSRRLLHKYSSHEWCQEYRDGREL